MNHPEGDIEWSDVGFVEKIERCTLAFEKEKEDTSPLLKIEQGWVIRLLSRPFIRSSLIL
jgi:hypothetical protein